MYNIFEFNWIYAVLLYDKHVINGGALLIIIFMSMSFFLLYLLILSSTIFLGLLILLLIFMVNIIMLYVLHQYLFALFLLGVYVGAILVFFIFVVMSFIFFGKSYIISHKLWILFSIIPIVLIFGYYLYINMINLSISSVYDIYFSDIIYNVDIYSIDDLKIIGILLFDYDMMYLVVVISFILFIALVGSITFNASSLVRYCSSFYIID